MTSLTDAKSVGASGNPFNSKPPEELSTDADDLPLPRDVRTVFQGGTFFLLMLGACYLAAEIILPIVLAFVLMLVLRPAMRFFDGLHVPRGLAALAIIVVLFGAIGGLTTVLTGPATDWAAKLPEGIPKLQERLSFLAKPITAVQRFITRAEGMTAGTEGKALSVKVEGTGLSERLISSTRNVVSGL